MLGKNYTYRGYSLSDDLARITNVGLQNVTKKKTIRGNAYPFANTHGSTIGPRLADSRVFTFSGKIVNNQGYQREKRWAELSSVFHIEGDPTSELFYPLEWLTKYGEARTAECMVYEPLDATNGLCDPAIEFNFQLVAKDPRVYDPQVVEVNGGLAQMGAGPLWNILPFEVENMFAGALECVHDGDRPAPMSIQITGEVVNPKIFIIQNNKITDFLKINKTTTDLFISNRRTSEQLSSNRFIIQDNGVRIDEFREKTNGGGPLFIAPSQEPFGGTKVSFIAVIADNFWQAKDTTTVKVLYRHTYSY